MNDESPFRNWFTWRQALTAGVTAGVLTGGYYSARPVYREFKRWRAHGFDAEGERFAAQNNLKQAYGKAEAALQLSPMDARSLRLMARVLGRSGHEQALPFWKQLLITKGSVPTDRYEMIAEAIRRQSWEDARTELNTAIQRPPVPVEIFRLASEFFAAQGDSAKSIDFARNAARDFPADPANALLLAQRLLASPDPNRLNEAKGILGAVAQREEPAGLEALVLLTTRFPPSPGEVDQYVQALRNHPKHGLEHEIMAFDLQLQQPQADRVRIIQQAVRRLEALGDEGVLHLVRWLNRNKEFARTLEILPATKSLTTQPLFLARADALAALGKWPEVDAALNGSSVPLDPFIISLYRARTAKEMGRADLVPYHWAQALRQANDNVQGLFYIADYAIKTGAYDEAIKAYRRLAENPPTAKAAYTELVRLQQVIGNTRDVRDAVAELMAKFPQEAAAQNDWAYLTLLLNEGVEEGSKIATLLFQKYPSMLAYRITFALAQLRLHDPAKAMTAFQGAIMDRVDWSGTLPGWQAVYAATLAGNGQLENARKFARQIPMPGLKPEERKLIQGLLDGPAGQ
ncbi:MAG: hypothetical protein HY301_12940 [Verrucomicrobia bacterium]|nr:hypothetical protein [Verrucomicrobiota bacterium]